MTMSKQGANRFADAVAKAVASEPGVKTGRMFDRTTQFVISSDREAAERVRKAVQYDLYVRGVFLRETEPDSGVYLLGISNAEDRRESGVVDRRKCGGTYGKRRGRRGSRRAQDEVLGIARRA